MKDQYPIIPMSVYISLEYVVITSLDVICSRKKIDKFIYRNNNNDNDNDNDNDNINWLELFGTSMIYKLKHINLWMREEKQTL